MDLNVPVLLNGVKVGEALKKGNASWVTVESGQHKEPFRRDIANQGAEWLGFNVSQYIKHRLAADVVPEFIELQDGMTETAQLAQHDNPVVAPTVSLEEIRRQAALQKHFVEVATETRSVSSSGGEKGVKPERYSLIPKPPLDLLARVYGFGEKKYAAHNYRKGYEWSKSYDALQRHLAAWWEREENDPESGLSHLGHAAFHIFALICFSKDSRYAEYDDRYGSGN